MITFVKCSISSQLNNMPRVVVTDFRLHDTSSLIASEASFLVCSIIDTIPRGMGLEALRISHISLTHSSSFRKCKFKPHLSAPMGFRGQFSRF